MHEHKALHERGAVKRAGPRGHFNSASTETRTRLLSLYPPGDHWGTREDQMFCLFQLALCVDLVINVRRKKKGLACTLAHTYRFRHHGVLEKKKHRKDKI